MKSRIPFAVLALALAAAAGVARTEEPAEKEPVTLSDGVTAMAEVVSTDTDSVTVRLHRGGADVELTLRAARLDPFAFYHLRRRHMDSTPENHVRLALYCAENGMFNQARFQMRTARALDPDIEKKFEERPEVVEGIAQRLAAAARRHLDAGRFDVARELAQLLATRFTETAAAAQADAMLDRIEERVVEREAKADAAREEKLRNEADAAAQAEETRRQAVVAPLAELLTAARRTESRALRQRNSNNAKNLHESATTSYEGLLAAVAKARSAAGDDAALAERLEGVAETARSECADVLVNTGQLLVPRSEFDDAEALARKALALVPGHSRALALLETVELAREEAEQLRDLQRARERRERGGR